MSKAKKKTNSSNKGLTISKKTLKQMDQSMMNLEKEKIFGPVDVK